VKPIKAIVNLAGAPLLSFQRWTDAYKNEVVQSRIGTTKTFVDFVRDLKEEKPEVYVSMSGVSKFGLKLVLVYFKKLFFKGYYKPDPVKEYTETSEGGDYDFLSRLSRDWEQASEPIEKKFNVRRVVLRSGMINRFIQEDFSIRDLVKYRSNSWFNRWHDSINVLAIFLQCRR